ncbi:Sugar phosphate isomerase/epimerase [Seinonella peptonophila]|uniref:Sugar phosphate isomerase/epimerase n=1 Tax=Seinonella peptonophila TaxID=112248 RepID=A0A1M5A8J5_9BACL|nr:sugar phosphate isomerase/epimerase [Seinonella peptonophila]SHF26457.1 Sugar phosphate isomerase/epimerase [Seinonella peptonophila]
MQHKFAAQLYTLRKECAENFPRVLRELKKMGWKAVQIDGLRGYAAEEIAEVLQETGLHVAGMHISLDRMVNDLDAVIHEGYLFQTKDIFCHYLDESMQNEEGYRNAKRLLLETAARLDGLGYRVGYHNHEFEFQSSVDGQIALDYLTTPVGNRFIYPEIDTYWALYAHIDPLTYISKFPFRCPIIHLKDMKDDLSLRYPDSLTEIGNGIIDFLSILRWGEHNGVEYYAVEQDICERNPLESLAISLEHLKKIAQEV